MDLELYLGFAVWIDARERAEQREARPQGGPPYPPARQGRSGMAPGGGRRRHGHGSTVEEKNISRNTPVTF